MKHLLIIVIVLASVTLPLSPAQAQATGAEEEMLVLKPVMIIRFNQPRVYFQKQLATVIRRAIQVKPDVQFDVIQYLPSGMQSDATNANLQSVVDGFAANGIAQNRVQAGIQTSPDITQDEVYIFVR